MIKNKDVKCVQLNLDREEKVHTNPDGKKIKIKKIGEEYFSKRKSYGNPKGNSWLFPNHLEYHGWLEFNGLSEVDIEELDDKWS